MQPQTVHADLSTPALAPSRQPGATGQGKHSPASIPASRLFQGSQEILIDHNSETYRLRITKNGKLILTK
jgi:hemin uptake protein HemP